jgi:outer membrane lipase/esterase
MLSKISRPFLAGATGLLLASCGGGGGPVEPFVPTRVLAIGDEMSLIESNGRKHSINAFRVTDPNTNPPTESTTETDCTRNPIWVQAVANNFGLPFAQCLGTAQEARSQILAQANAKAGSFAAQLAARQGAGLNDKDLVLVMLGMHDVLELYAQFPGRSAADLSNEITARGEQLGRSVSDLARSGPAVVVLTLHDLGLTPFATAENTRTGDTGRAGLLTELTAAFNRGMSRQLVNDGRLIGIVLNEDDSRSFSRFPASFGLSNATAAACRSTAVLPDCTTATLIENATAFNHLWADSLRPGPTYHARMAVGAETRARNNPF